MNKAELCILAITASFVFLVGGFFLGRFSRNAVITQPDEQLQLPVSTEENPGLIDLNTATVENLTTLPGVGEIRAKAIIEYREAIGGFKTVYQLEGVSGIGPKIMEDLLPYITVS